VDRSVALRAGAAQAAGVAVVSVVLALALPESFFEDWGWIAGPAAWMAVAAAVARLLRLALPSALTGAALAGVPSVFAVLVGVHWAGAAIAVVLFALWCGRLAVDRELEAEVL
jgi:hypothetical protein